MWRGEGEVRRGKGCSVWKGELRCHKGRTDTLEFIIIGGVKMMLGCFQMCK